MKKMLLIIYLLISGVTNAQKGYWLCKSYRVIDSTKLFSHSGIGLIIDFNNSKLMTLKKDTAINVKIDKVRRLITYKNDPLKLNYKKVNNTIEIRDNNTTNIFYPFEFKAKQNLSKKKVIEKLTLNKIKPIRDSLKLKFTNNKNIYYPHLKILITQFINYDKFKSNWFLEEINKNLFLGISSEFEPYEIHYFRIIKINKKSIDVEPIIEYDFLPNLSKIEFEK
ncbi:MAG: hypothetical protein ACPGUU_00705 [Flavobacteriaceae bacterium]